MDDGRQPTTKRRGSPTREERALALIRNLIPPSVALRSVGIPLAGALDTALVAKIAEAVAQGRTAIV
jgi:hypothetical protein